MSIHVAGPLAETKRVQEVQSAVVSLPDHKLTRDSSRGPDVTFAGQWIPAEVSAELAATELNAVMTAESVLVWHPNTMDVEGSSSLELRLPGLGTVTLSTLLSSPRFDTNAFYYHPAVQRVSAVDDWLAWSDLDAGRHAGAFGHSAG